MRFRTLGRVGAVGAVGLVAAVAVALGVPAAAQTDPAIACAPRPDLAPAVPVVVVLDAASGISREEVDAGVEAQAAVVTVQARVALEEVRPDGGPGGGRPGDEQPGDDQPGGQEPGDDEPDDEEPPAEGEAGEWVEVTTEADVVAELTTVAGTTGIVVLVVGDGRLAASLRPATPLGVAVAPQPIGATDLADGATTLGQAAEATQRILLGQIPATVAPQGPARVRLIDERWVIDLPDRPATLAAVVQTARLTMPAATGREAPATVDLPCVGAELPLAVEGEDLDGATIDLELLVGGTLAVIARATLDDAAATGDGSDQPSDDDDDDDRDEERATSGSNGDADGGGGLFLPLLVGVLLLGGLVAAGLVLNRRNVAPAVAGPSPFGGHRPGAGPPPAAPPARSAAPAPPPPPPPTPADDSWRTAATGEPPLALPAGSALVAGSGTGRRRWWALTTSRGMHLAGWLEKVDGRGEDAPPLLHLHASGAVVVGVFDGTGGSGSAVARREADGTERTGAWVASRLAREVTADWATATLLDPGPDEASLADRLRRWFHHEDAAFAGERPVVRGSLHRVLPTTLAAAAVTPGEGGAVLDVFWAGDSRCYLLRPDRGLQVLTRDDTREGDALALIRDDQPMSNLVSADRPFTVNHVRRRIPLPSVVVAATDGCFGYVATPAHFELLLLETLVASSSAEVWMEALVDRLDSVAGDDASFTIACPGLRDFETLRRAVVGRLEELRTTHGAPFAQVAGDEEHEAARERSWTIYRPDYEALLPEGGGP